MRLIFSWSAHTGQTIQNSIFIAALVGVALVSATILSGNPALADDDAPIVLFLSISSNPEGAQLEEDISSEIALSLTNFKVITLRENLPFVPDAPNHLERLKRIAFANNAVAIVWIVQDPSGFQLNMLVISEDQAIIRLVEAKEGPETPGVLALIVEELLGQTYQFENPSPAHPSEQITQTPSANPSVPPVDQKNKGASAKHPKWSLVFSSGVGGGLISDAGPSLKFIGTIALERTIKKKWYIFPDARFLMSPKQDESNYSHRTIGGAIGFGAGYKLQFHWFALCPQLSIRGVWQKLDVGVGDSTSTSFHLVNGSLEFALRFQWTIGKAIFLALSPAASLNTVQKFFHSAANVEVEYTSPRIEWQVLGTIGIHLF